MTERHDLRHEFPEHITTIHQLKLSDPQFHAMFDAYHDLDREVRRMEDGIEPVSDDVLEEKKKERLRLKDALYARIREARAASS